MEVMTIGVGSSQVDDGGLRPVLKWAGGKRSIMDEILKRTPKTFDRYVEPFLGGGAVLFEIAPPRALANDLNDELINLYEVIRRHPDLLVAQIQAWIPLVSSEFYYEIRSWDRDKEWLGSVSTVQRAARTIFLNRAGFNGLFRVNGNGQFNVPYGKNPTVSLIDPDLIARLSDYLTSADVVFSSGSYEEVIEECGEGDFIYLDPPYAILDEAKNGFTAYTKDGFSDRDLENLAMTLDRATNRGARWLLSNVDSDLTRKIFCEDRFLVESIQVRRPISARSESRKAVGEILVRPRRV